MLSRLPLFTLCSFLFLFVSCNSDSSVNDMPPDENGDDNNDAESISEAFPNLSFERPLNITHAGDQSDRLFVEEQGGLIHVFEQPHFLEITGNYGFFHKKRLIKLVIS